TERALVGLGGRRLQVEDGNAAARPLENRAIELLGAEADVEHPRRRERLEQLHRGVDRALEGREVIGRECAKAGVLVEPLSPESLALVLETVIEVPVEMVLARREAVEPRGIEVRRLWRG